ncbi:mitochondrial Usp domain-containing protein [Andalucia godoyi]|uniref:Mitochondrial Usp domain-containing protein n=1 Tax=Andalucia godoyi TaxID=505711 RepID=A0A8K0F0S7_ANDGO|nr:mitochondrial Usp domain-containing protein [Andalucia godoyi]|eukprot:ANDGO_03952.mRNA.1 mitochondrial Usp domain-containing protein
MSSSSQKLSRQWVVAVDGSRIAKRAFDAAICLMNHEDELNDVLHVIHVAPKDPVELSEMGAQFRPQHILNEYTEHCRHAKIIYDAVPPSKLETSVELVNVQGKMTSDNIVQAVLSAASKDGAHFVVVGSFGSGKHESSSSNIKQESTNLGTVAQASIYKSHCTVVLVKNVGITPAAVETQRTTPIRFYIAVDGSLPSRYAWDQLQLLVDPKRGDSITLVHLFSGSFDLGQELAASYKPHKAGAVVNYVVQPRDKSKSVGVDLCEYVNAEDVDYLVVGSEVLLKENHLGSVCEWCTIHARCHIVVCKPSVMYSSTTGVYDS